MITQLPKILDERGNLTFFESNNHVPFEIKRTCWIYDMTVNIGNPAEISLKEFAEEVIKLTGIQQKLSINRCR